ncbi:hypothetical protein TNCV_1413591 [Trichonephila clavipes]|nr:hypothetical protein TNCV_1413591 [Trichonephila clavipes]
MKAPSQHVAKTVRHFCSAQHVQLLPWPAYSPNMFPIEPAWDLTDHLIETSAHAPQRPMVMYTGMGTVAPSPHELLRY